MCLLARRVRRALSPGSSLARGNTPAGIPAGRRCRGRQPGRKACRTRAVSPAAADGAAWAASARSGMRNVNVAGRGRGPAEEQEKIMRRLGHVAAITVAVAAVALGLLAVRSLPEIRRYLAIRKM